MCVVFSDRSTTSELGLKCPRHIQLIVFNPFADESPVTARADSHPFYSL